MRLELTTRPSRNSDDTKVKNICYPDDWSCKPKSGGGLCGPSADYYPSDCTPDGNVECSPDDPCYTDKCFPQK